MDLTDSTIAQYQIVEKIGQGGMATVYKAYQPSLDRHVAVKVMASDLSRSENFAVRFEREARAIAKLRHRNILTIYDYGRQDDMLYLAMEYVEGGTLKERLGWPQKLSYAVDIITQIGGALAHAHRQGVIHRDIKPANVLVANDDWLLLSDFGLVKMAEESVQLTMSGTSLGTPQYMSPEQAQAMEIDQRSDIYSLGVVLYEAITGQTPFGTDNPVAIIMKHINEPIIPPHTLRPDLPPGMERVILKALAKSPEDRYQRMDDFLEDLQATQATSDNLEAGPAANGAAASADPVKEYATTATPVPPTKVRHARRKRGFPWLGLSISVIILLIIGLSAFIFRDSVPALAAVLYEAGALPPAVSEVIMPPTATPTEGVTEATSVTQSTTTATDFTPSTVPPTPTPIVEGTSTPTPAPPTATPLVITTRLSERDGAEMVFVPAGAFLMGSESLGDDERPVRTVFLDDFWLDRYEVTNEQFSRFVETTGYETEAEQEGWGWISAGAEWEAVDGANWRHPAGPDSDLDGKADHPVVLISWADANIYCQWANKRLPTEAEWEKAARGPAGAVYAWGESFDATLANTEEGGYGDTLPVGSFSPAGDSPYGAADMTGNVWEWVADWYDNDYYQEAPADNPPGPPTGSDKVLRGGSWLFDQLYARSAFRYNVRPDYTYDFTGFRCAGSD